MTRRPDLGPILAVAGAVIAGIAIIAGLLVIGGPGDERNKRLDNLTEERIDATLAVVQCAFSVTGVAPATLADAAGQPGFKMGEQTRGPCRIPASSEFNEYIDGTPPHEPGEISYTVTAPDSIRLCGYFRSARKAGEPNCSSRFVHTYPVLDEPRPAGSHCYAITLIKLTDMDVTPPFGGHSADCAFMITH